MRRPSVLVVTLAVIASTLVLASRATAVDTAPAPIATPASPESGQTFTLTGNIGTTGSRAVELQRSDSGTWTKYKTGTTNSSGDYSFTAQTTAPTRVYRIHAAATSSLPAVDTEALTMTTTTPLPGTNAPAPTATPTSPISGQTFTLSGNLGTSGSRSVELQRNDSGTWTKYKTGTTTSSGAYSFTASTTEPTRTYRVHAPASGSSPALDTDPLTVTTIQPPKVSLHILRDCTGNDCGSTATATGALDPVQEGRVLKLQYKSGSSWVSVVGATPSATGADGKVQIQFALSGLPQWTTRTYRVTDADPAVSPASTSPEIQFMPGPTQLGTNVVRVDVDQGIYPVVKGPEYTGVATLSVNGTTAFDHVPLETFGVRGHTTADYVKKPYKLKFLNKPPKNTTVFGMPRGKSWTLLAGFKDGSAVREKVGLDLSRRMSHIAWTPQSRYIEMFVNDQYRGSYLMTESVKIDPDRVNINETSGMMMEADGESVVDPKLGFMSTIGKNVFAFKDPDQIKDGGADPTGVTPEKLTAIKDRINAFESKLYTAATRTQYPDYIDVDSAIDYNLAREFAKGGDIAFWRSAYFSWDPSDPDGTSGNPLRDGKFHFGPVWDFDGTAGNACCGTASNYASSAQGWMMRGTGTSTGDRTYKTQWFVQLFKDPVFAAAVKTRWAEVKGEFAKAYLTDTADDKTAIGVGAANDRNRWPSSTRPRASRGSYDQEVAFVTKWYKDRYTWMDGQLSN